MEMGLPAGEVGLQIQIVFNTENILPEGHFSGEGSDCRPSIITL